MIIKKTLTATLLACPSASFQPPRPRVEHNTQAFLDALAAGGGKPLKQLSPRTPVQADRCAGFGESGLYGVEVSDKAIKAMARPST